MPPALTKKSGAIKTPSASPEASPRQAWGMRTIQHRDDLHCPPGNCDLLVLPEQPFRRFVVGFAASPRMVEAAQRLRYAVFSQELGHTTQTAVNGLDVDAFDAHMTHLMLLDANSWLPVGTYRVQTADHGLGAAGLYCAQEYNLAPLHELLPLAAECGRACIAREWRKATSLMALWIGLKAFMTLHGKRWMFGCCSLNSQDPDEGWRTLRALRAGGCLHPQYLLETTPTFACAPGIEMPTTDAEPAIELPKLFATYLKLGAKVISYPALDRDFGTIDFLILADGLNVQLSGLSLA